MSTTPNPDGSSPLKHPLCPLWGWTNDDLLLNPNARAEFTRVHGQAVAIFDWPEMRALFETNDPKAARIRKATRKFGMLTIGLGCLAAVIVAVAPITDLLPGIQPASRDFILGLIIALLAITSAAVGAFSTLSGEQKWRWLHNRLVWERLRQLHFQLIVNNLPLAVRAMKGGAGLRRWLAMRADALDRFEALYLAADAPPIDRISAELLEADPWFDRNWHRPPRTPKPSPQLDMLLRIMGAQRFGVQRDYTHLKLRPGLFSPRTRWKLVSWFSGFSNSLLSLLTLLAGVLLVMGFAFQSMAVVCVLAVAGMLGTLAGSLRDLGEGMGLRAEADRLETYRDEIRTLERRYVDADDRQKVRILHDLERVSYQEMRAFVLETAEMSVII